MENDNSNKDSGDQESDRKGFAFRKNHLTRGSIIDGEFSNSVCFREALTILSEDNIDIGQLSVNIDKEKGTNETIYIVFVSLTEYRERFKHTNTVFGRVTHDFTTLEERRSDILQLGKKKIERNITLVNEGDEYCVSLSFYDGKDWERDSLEITKENSQTLMGEAANYLYVRFLAQSGKCTAINFLSLLCDGSLHMSRYVSSPIGASKLGREKREVCTMCVKRMLLNPRGKITAEWILTKGAGYILEEKREIPHGSVTHPMMRYCNGNDTSNEGDDISEDEWLRILRMELPPGGEEKKNTTEEGGKPLKNDSRNHQPTETFGNPVAHGENEETQVMEGGEKLTPDNETPILDKIMKDHGGPVISADSDLSEEIISKVSINSDDAFQKKKMNNRTLTEGIAEEQEEVWSNEDKESNQSSQSDEIKAKSSPDEYVNGNLNPSGKGAAKEQERDDSSTETNHSDEEEKSTKRMKYENYQWPDISHLEEEIEGIVVRTMDDILSGYEKVRRENVKLRNCVRKMSLEEEKLRRKLRGKDRKPHWRLADGIRLIAIPKKSLVTNDGKVDQSAIPLVCRWRDDQQLFSAYLDKKIQQKEFIRSYLAKHTEIINLMSDYLLHVLLEKPEDVVTFSIDYFKGFD